MGVSVKHVHIISLVGDVSASYDLSLPRRSALYTVNSSHYVIRLDVDRSRPIWRWRSHGVGDVQQPSLILILPHPWHPFSVSNRRPRITCLFDLWPYNAPNIRQEWYLSRIRSAPTFSEIFSSIISKGTTLMAGVRTALRIPPHYRSHTSPVIAVSQFLITLYW